MKTVTSTRDGEPTQDRSANPWTAPPRRPLAEEPPTEVWPPVPVPAPRNPPAIRAAVAAEPEPVPQAESALESWLAVPVPRPGDRVTPPGRTRPPRPPRRPAIGLPALVALALLAAFFGWVSAEPLWVALGHAEGGTVTVTRCSGEGLRQGCVGEFTGEAFTVAEVTLIGVEVADRRAGAAVAARMVSPDGRGAYAGDGLTLHLRWAVGLVLVLGCGFGIALATGARRLPSRPARLGALATSLVAPVLVVAGFLLASF